MTPAMILFWIQAVTEAAATVERLMVLGRRIGAGEEITQEELDAAKQKTDEAVDNWDAAAEHDKE